MVATILCCYCLLFISILYNPVSIIYLAIVSPECPKMLFLAHVKKLKTENKKIKKFTRKQEYRSISKTRGSKNFLFTL